jgi:hypothetical protein
MTLQLHRPDGKGGLEKRPAESDWRSGLRTPRWGSALRKGRLPILANPEMDPTPTAISVAFWVSLAIVTLVLLVAGYGSGFWHVRP